MRANLLCAVVTTSALAFAACHAIAQDAPPTDSNNAVLVPESTLTPEESAMLGNALVFDPLVLAEPPKNRSAFRPTEVMRSHAPTSPMAQAR